MSGRQAKVKRKAQGNPRKRTKEPTPLLERSYIQAPVGLNPDGTIRYRSGTQIKKFLARKGVAVEELGDELREWMKVYTAEAAKG